MITFEEIKDTRNPYYPYGVQFTVEGGSGIDRVTTLYTISMTVSAWCGERFDMLTWRCDDQGVLATRFLFNDANQLFETKLRWHGCTMRDFEAAYPR